MVNEKYFSVDKLLFGDLAMWGAIYVAFAVIFVALGLLILLGSTLGIMLGAVIAVLHGWTALLTIGAYPLWAVTVIVIDCDRVFASGLPLVVPLSVTSKENVPLPVASAAAMNCMPWISESV